MERSKQQQCKGAYIFLLLTLVVEPDGADWLMTDAAHGMLSMAGQLGLVLMLCQAGSQWIWNCYDKPAFVV